jgi:hypothetical protein
MLSVGGVVGNENERIGKSESIGGVLSDCVYMDDAMRGIGLERRQDPRCRGVKTEGAWRLVSVLGDMQGWHGVCL